MIENDPYHRWINHLNNRLKNNWDNMIFLTGERGAGKSTRALQIAKSLSPSFNMERNIVYLPDEIIVKAKELKPFEVVLIDEAGECANSSEYMEIINRTLYKAFIGLRYKRLHWMWCAPRYKDISGGLRSMAKYLIDVKNRRLTMVYRLDQPTFYSKKNLPYRHTLFTWRTRPLPRDVYKRYADYKSIQGDRRLNVYLAQIKRHTDISLRIEDIRREIVDNINDFLNDKGYVDSDLIYIKYVNQGLSMPVCRGIKKSIENELRQQKKAVVNHAETA